MIKPCDCRERHNVRNFSLNRIDDFSTSHHDVVNTKSRVDLFIRSETNAVTAYQGSLSYTKTSETQKYNTQTKHLLERKRCYHNTKLSCHSVEQNDC